MIRRTCSCVLLVLSIALPHRAWAASPEVGDVELMETLYKLENFYPGARSLNRWNSFWYGATSLAIAGVGVAGLYGASQVLFEDLDHLQKIVPLKRVKWERVREMLRLNMQTGGRYALKGLALSTVSAWAVSEMYAHWDDVEKKQLRIAAGAQPSIYANHLREFFALPIEERFVLAKMDPNFAAALIALAKSPARRTWPVIEILKDLNLRTRRAVDERLKPKNS